MLMRSLFQKLAAVLLCCTLAVSLAGCGSRVTDVALNLPDSVEKGTTLTAAPEYSFDGTAPEGDALTKALSGLGMSYTSSDPAVLLVDENGNIAAVGTGTAEITLSSKDGKITASQTLEVKAVPTAITVPDALTLTAGESAKLETSVEPSDAMAVSVQYASSDEAVATVNEQGEVTAVAAGEATITAQIADPALSAECKVTVLPAVESVALNQTALTLQPGSTAQLTYTVSPADAKAEDAVFASSDEAVATVDASGNVSAVADGTATITVTVSGVSAECEVTVSAKAAAAAGSKGSAESAESAAQNAPKAASSGMESGAIPFSLASDNNWWSIDQSDSAYWAVLDNINAMRAAGGLGALSPSSSLDSIADSRCDYQLVNDTLSHDGAQTPEILAQSQKSAAEVCTAWQNSPSHYAVIMNPNFTQIGICCYFEISGKTIWCCTFS